MTRGESIVVRLLDTLKLTPPEHIDRVIGDELAMWIDESIKEFSGSAIPDNDKIKHLQMMISAIRVTTREILTLVYQLARFHDSASFILTFRDLDILKHKERLETDYIIAQQIVAKEK